ncbi:DCN1-like protein 3 [Copidosoma floridanum]|uniref:DCN1-like protein 3 n=1 Tax=Copidosoma floridanum TaxID=29053 RepID=UPI0006C991B7|nr:DCN1-like protein 3 [Copidosoma floridanum]
MGNCLSCFKVSPPPVTENQSPVLDLKEETMELRTLYQHNQSQNHSHKTVESQVNGNKRTTINNTTPFNGVDLDNCSSMPIVQGSLRSFYSKLPPSNKSATSIAVSTATECKQKEPSEVRIHSLFECYKDSREDLILADGMEKLCTDLQLSPDEFKVLVLAWKLNAEQMCQFTRQEFIQGLKAMRVDSIKGIQHRLPDIVEELKTNAELFKDLYRFTFRFGLDVSSGQRILPADMAIVLWRLVFTIREPPLLERWLNFLESHPVRGIPRDTWNMFLNFAESIGNDLSAYDDAEAWPSLFDDFVEYENDQMNQNVTKNDFLKD